MSRILAAAAIVAAFLAGPNPAAVSAQTPSRLAGTFGSPNEAAGYLVVMVPLALTLALAPVRASGTITTR